MRERIIGALALATAVVAVTHYNLDGAVATLIVFVGAYVLATRLWTLVWANCAGLLCMLSLLIYLATFAMGLDHLPGMLVTLFLPVISQVYLIWAMWPATGSLFHPVTLGCLMWLVLLGIITFDGKPVLRLASAALRPRTVRKRLLVNPSVTRDQRE